MSRTSDQNSITNNGSNGIMLCAALTAFIILVLTIILCGICLQGLTAFWPNSIRMFTLNDQTRIVGELLSSNTDVNGEMNLYIKQGNRDSLGMDYIWIKETAVAEISLPSDFLLVERNQGGNFYGKLLAERPTELIFEQASGMQYVMPRSNVSYIIAVNSLSTLSKLQIAARRFFNFLTEEPREANTEGGILQALLGTVLMVMVMAFFATPIGVVTAIYLREYAKGGLFVSVIRTIVNNLAGVPSIVYGVFGLGFFVYRMGYSIDQLFFYDSLPNPTFGTGGLLWASLTLALLTLPSIIVATEEGLASLPRNLREASYALGATKAETVLRIIIPAIAPSILTGMILAISRAAGEVAPLMVTGVVKLAPALPIDLSAPFLHLDRKFMHLGFHIYDLALQSPNAEAVRPTVYATTMLLLLIVLIANLGAIWMRARLRKNLGSQGF